MWRKGLVWQLPWFAVSLVVQMVHLAVLSQQAYGSSGYFYAWLAGERALLVSIGLAGLEIYFRFNRAIYRAGRVGLFVLVAAGIAGSTVAMSTLPDTSAEWSAVTADLLGAKRVLLTVLAVALAAILGFYRRLAIPVASYVWPHGTIFLFYVATHAAGLWLAETSGSRWLAGINQASLWTWIGCLAGWLYVFSKEVVLPAEPTDAAVVEADLRARRLDRVVGQ